MASVASPYGLIPVGLIGGQPYAGATRELRMTTNSATGIFAGDLIAVAGGQPAAVTATPVAGTQAGLVGPVTGVRYIGGTNPQPLWAQYLPANAITNGATSVFIYVADDPDLIFKVQSQAIGSYGDARQAIGKNAALGNFGAGSTVSGNSGVNLVCGANGTGFATTNTLAVRVVDVVKGTELDAFPEFLVKFNAGVHSYNFATGA